MACVVIMTYVVIAKLINLTKHIVIYQTNMARTRKTEQVRLLILPGNIVVEEYKKERKTKKLFGIIPIKRYSYLRTVLVTDCRDNSGKKSPIGYIVNPNINEKTEKETSDQNKT